MDYVWFGCICGLPGSVTAQKPQRSRKTRKCTIERVWSLSVEAALPLRLAALKASHYLVFRYSLVRSGTQKAALQEELDRGMSLDYAELASC